MITDNYRYKQGIRFKPPWDLKIPFFEFVSYYEDNDLIHLKAYSKEGEPYDTEIRFIDYDDSYFKDVYLPLEHS